MGLRRLFKKARKALHLPAITLGNVAKVGLAAAGGGIPAVGAAVLRSKLKSAAVGGIKRIVRTKAEKHLVAKLRALAPTGSSSAPATTMPGGAPLAAAARAVRTARATHSRRKRRSGPTLANARRAMKVKGGAFEGMSEAERSAYLRAGGRKSRRKAASGAKRRPPKGGKDFKALSASWKAAGKPGRWIDWVKSH